MLLRLQSFCACFILLAGLLSVPAQGSAWPPEPIPLTLPDFLSGKYDVGKSVKATTTFTGTVQDVFDDETEPTYLFLSVKFETEDIHVVIDRNGKSAADYACLIGAEVVFIGYCNGFFFENSFSRRHIGQHFAIPKVGSFRVVRPGPDLYSVPDVSLLNSARAAEITKSGRRRATGRVIATWSNDKVLISTPSNRLVQLDLVSGRLPLFGTTIEAVGFPETDLYRINLSRAFWRPASTQAPVADTVQDATIEKIARVSHNGMTTFHIQLYGRTVRLSGTLDSPPRDGIIKISEGPNSILVDITALKGELPLGFLPGCTLEITGVVVPDIDVWRPHAQLPRIRSATLVTRLPSDLRVIRRPPFWTVGKLLSVIGGLLAILIGTFIWNRSLSNAARKKGRELYREQIHALRSELKFQERTALAVELHDAISQHLTGIALELRTVRGLAENISGDAQHHLDVATHTLASCRDELRNCLWDLRHSTLDLNDVEQAIRLTVVPHVGSAALHVRFRVPRHRITDNITHTILQIVRELATNSVRHGNATDIRIAGALEGNKLMFSVQDNGAGFVPDACPGMEEGHFGLLGVRERLEKFDGTLEITSAPRIGTKAVATLTIQTLNT